MSAWTILCVCRAEVDRCAVSRTAGERSQSVDPPGWAQGGAGRTVRAAHAARGGYTCAGAAGLAGERDAPEGHRLHRHRRHRPGRLPVDGALPALRRHVRRRGPRLVAVRPRSPRAHSRGHRSLCGGLPEPEDVLGSLSGTGCPARADQAGRDRVGAARRRRPRDGRLGLDRPQRAPQRPSSAVGAGVGRHRRSRPGAARRARHPAEAPRLLHRRPEQDVERRGLRLHRAAAPQGCG